MKLAQNKKIKLIVLGLLTGFLSVFSLITPSLVQAGDPSLENPTLALCYTQSTGLVQQINLNQSSSSEACVNAGGRVIKGGEPVPVPICVIQNTGNISQIKEASGRSACTGTGGYVIETGVALPKLNAGGTSTSSDENNNSIENCDATKLSESAEKCEVPSDCKDADLSADNCGITHLLIIVINVLSTSVAIVVVLVVIIGGIQYSTSAGDPSKAAAAKKRIGNALLALVFFSFMYGFLQWLVPGGLFNG